MRDADFYRLSDRVRALENKVGELQEQIKGLVTHAELEKEKEEQRQRERDEARVRVVALEKTLKRLVLPGFAPKWDSPLLKYWEKAREMAYEALAEGK